MSGCRGSPFELLIGDSIVTFSTAHRLLDLLLAQPLLRGHEIPAEERKDRRRTKDDTDKVERGGRHGEV